MPQIFIANVKFFDQRADKTVTHTIVVQTCSYGEAVVAIERTYGKTIESIDSITGVGNGSVICLGTRNDKVDAAVEVICENNCY
jgi:hypothetical protein